MNTQTTLAITSIISELRKNCNDFSPIRMNIAKYYDSFFIGTLVKEVSDDLENILSQHKEIFANERLEDITHSFQFTLKAILNNGKKVSDHQELFEKIIGFSLLEEDVLFALSNPKAYTISKIDYTKDEEIELLFNARESTFDFTQSCNNNYITNKRAFIIAVILLCSELKKSYDPIENISNDYSRLKEFLLLKNVDLMSDSEFSSYQLISTNQNVKLINSFPARLYHHIADVTIFINGIDDYIFKYLMGLQAANDFKLSLKPSSTFFCDGKYVTGKLEEHLETGKYFDPNNFKSKLITKLYDNNYETLWIKIESNNLTFEELINDYRIYGDDIITQVVHSQYSVDENDVLYITHLDHEFIFYTLDEYQKRQQDPNQKGNAKKRIKTFKIDDAKIEIKEDDNILYKLLLMLFDNKDLIMEYFNEQE
jgi:hypothetical protein